jgi:hypothetical protein
VRRIRCGWLILLNATPRRRSTVRQFGKSSDIYSTPEAVADESAASARVRPAGDPARVSAGPATGQQDWVAPRAAWVEVRSARLSSVAVRPRLVEQGDIHRSLRHVVEVDLAVFELRHMTGFAKRGPQGGPAGLPGARRRLGETTQPSASLSGACDAFPLIGLGPRSDPTNLFRRAHHGAHRFVKCTFGPLPSLRYCERPGGHLRGRHPKVEAREPSSVVVFSLYHGCTDAHCCGPHSRCAARTETERGRAPNLGCESLPDGARQRVWPSANSAACLAPPRSATDYRCF